MHEPLLRKLYAAFNARDIEGALTYMTADVDWPNAWEGGRVHGHDAVRDYWTRQFAAIDPKVEPTAFKPTPDGIVVTVHQTVHSRDGALLDDHKVKHTYVVRHGLVARMDVS